MSEAPRVRIYCDGVFDLLHGGHLKHLQEVQSKGGCLVVGVLAEMKRVARKTVFLGDLRSEGHAAKMKKHVFGDEIPPILFTPADSSRPGVLWNNGFDTMDGWWGGPSRFNALFRA